MKEHDFEPVPGLPAELPEGEKLLWQGAPDWWALGQRAFHMRSVALYFAVLIVWRGLAEGSFAAALQLAPFALLSLALLAGLAALTARTTVYTITTKRLVMRFGVALPKAINIPYTIVAAADLRSYGDDSGDISLTLTEPNRINYFLLWPHARPFKLSHPQPTLRAIADGAAVAALLTDAVRAGAADKTVLRATEADVQPARAPELCPA